MKEEIWHQHLDWMDVMGKQVDENFVRHSARLQEDAAQGKRLSQASAQKKKNVNCTQGLFSRKNRSGRV